MPSLRASLRDFRYAIPDHVERWLKGPTARAAALRATSLHRQGYFGTLGYFQSTDSSPDEIVAANRAVVAEFGDRATGVHLSVKAPPLGFDRARIEGIAEAAAASGMSLIFDSHTASDAEPTLDLAAGMIDRFPGTGLALPARWRRSRADAERFRDSDGRIRLVKGEWADPAGDVTDIEAAFLSLASDLAGRSAAVGIASHDPQLAARALQILQAGGTPCELEQLRGLPRRRTTAVARSLGVPIRLYLPFGPGWWPYAVDKALARPYLPAWIVRDWFAQGASAGRYLATPPVKPTTAPTGYF